MKLFLPDTPDRMAVIAQLKALPELPEADRMRTKPCAWAPMKRSIWQQRAEQILQRRKSA